MGHLGTCAAHRVAGMESERAVTTSPDVRRALAAYTIRRTFATPSCPC